MWEVLVSKLISWTGTGKKDKIKIQEEILAAIENHRINLAEIRDEKTLKYLSGFKRFSTERVMKSLAGELTENEKWSISGNLMGECWYRDCCVLDHKNRLRCVEPEIESGNKKMTTLILSETVQHVLKRM